jgi:hypothetical protein
MKTRFLLFTFFITALISPALMAKTGNEIREVPVFTEISLRIPGKLHFRQGEQQKVEIEASASTLKELITEVSGRTLILRFPARNILNRNFDPGRINIYITAPDVNVMAVSGSGDIIVEGGLNTRIMDLNISGSGSIIIDRMDASKVKAVISGSGDIIIHDGQTADEFTGTISGSGNIKASEYEAKDVSVRIAGSGNCHIHTNGSLNARIAGSGSVFYGGNPSLDTNVAGSGKVVEKN